MENYIFTEGPCTEHLVIIPTTSPHSQISHLLPNERRLVDDDICNILQYHTNFNVSQGAEYSNDWMFPHISEHEFMAHESSTSSLPSSVAFPSSAPTSWASPDLISEAESNITTTTDDSELMDPCGGNAAEGNLSFWTVDSETGVRHYQCECGKITKNKGDMRRHRQTLKHSGRSYTCPCGGSYTRNDSLKRHVQICSFAAGNLSNE